MLFYVFKVQKNPSQNSHNYCSSNHKIIVKNYFYKQEHIATSQWLQQVRFSGYILAKRRCCCWLQSRAHQLWYPKSVLPRAIRLHTGRDVTSAPRGTVTQAAAARLQPAALGSRQTRCVRCIRIRIQLSVCAPLSHAAARTPSPTCAQLKSKPNQHHDKGQLFLFNSSWTVFSRRQLMGSLRAPGLCNIIVESAVHAIFVINIRVAYYFNLLRATLHWIWNIYTPISIETH